MRTIQYAWDEDTGQVWSQYGYNRDLAVPVLDFEGMTPENGWDMKFPLKKMSGDSQTYAHLIWTRKVPLEIKNVHRKFWGLKPIVREPNWNEQGLTKRQWRAKLAVGGENNVTTTGV